MRAIRWMVLAIAMLAGAAGMRTTAVEAAPLPVSSAVAQTEAAQGAVVQKAYYGYRRFGGYRRSYGYRPRFYGRRAYGYRPFYRRPIYRRRFFY